MVIGSIAADHWGPWNGSSARDARFRLELYQQFAKKQDDDEDWEMTFQLLHLLYVPNYLTGTKKVCLSRTSTFEVHIHVYLTHVRRQAQCLI
ncbi:hypothetical protein NDU88_004296 [Pleurodeles waltl]|uniref:Uncharacterized protein n=1 Tax=Pleurodeles waltl TaxID=8319 RepID=A0AAV7KZ36_PLEWA|nr:hypothetical protein NDU88_004296 [Pleurodeles waltl]